MDDKKIKDAFFTQSQDVEVDSPLKYKTLNYIDLKVKRSRRHYRFGLAGALSLATGLVMVFAPLQPNSTSPDNADLINESQDASIESRGVQSERDLFSEFMQILDEHEVCYKVNLETQKDAVKVYNIQIQKKKHYFVIMTLDEATEVEQTENILRFLKEELKEYGTYKRIKIDENHYIIFNEAHPDILKYSALLTQ